MKNAKKITRDQVTAELNGITTDELQKISRRVQANLSELPVLNDADAVACYIPYRQEIDLLPLIRQFIAAGKRVAFPRYLEGSGLYEMAVVSDLDKDFHTGKYGIPEPTAACRALDCDVAGKIAWFIPGIAFDLGGGRLGRGGGFYDRLLNSTNNIKIGIACSCQIVDSVPLEPHDIRMDYVVTENSRHDCIK